MEYRIDRTTSELQISGPKFINRLKNYIYLGDPGHFLYYDASNAVEVRTDFRTNLDILSVHTNVSNFFKKSTLVFEDEYIIVFDVDTDTLDRIAGIPSGVKSRSLSEIILCRGGAKSLSASELLAAEDSINDLVYSKNQDPKKIQHSPSGYPIGGYYVRVAKAPGTQPNNARVFTIYNEETQDPFIKLNYYHK